MSFSADLCTYNFSQVKHKVFKFVVVSEHGQRPPSSILILCEKSIWIFLNMNMTLRKSCFCQSNKSTVINFLHQIPRLGHGPGHHR